MYEYELYPSNGLNIPENIVVFSCKYSRYADENDDYYTYAASPADNRQKVENIRSKLIQINHHKLGFTNVEYPNERLIKNDKLQVRLDLYSNRVNWVTSNNNVVCTCVRIRTEDNYEFRAKVTNISVLNCINKHGYDGWINGEFKLSTKDGVWILLDAADAEKAKAKNIKKNSEPKTVVYEVGKKYAVSKDAYNSTIYLGKLYTHLKETKIWGQYEWSKKAIPLYIMQKSYIMENVSSDISDMKIIMNDYYNKIKGNSSGTIMRINDICEGLWTKKRPRAVFEDAVITKNLDENIYELFDNIRSYLIKNRKTFSNYYMREIYKLLSICKTDEDIEDPEKDFDLSLFDYMNKGYSLRLPNGKVIEGKYD